MTPDLDALMAHATAAGRECVVGAVILDGRGRVFTPRRVATAATFPGLWDLPGGHVERGESLVAALAREVAEETGWSVCGEPALAFVSEWEIVDHGRVRRHREFDFVTEVVGDLAGPRLRDDEHDDYQWVDAAALGLFDENGGRDGGLVRRAAEAGLRYAARGELTYPHVTLFVPEPAASEIDRLRSVWDPAMAAQIAPHVTVAYPDELGSLEAALAFIDAAAEEVDAFAMELGAMTNPGDPGDGVFFDMDDVANQWARLRALVPGQTLGTHAVAPHVTVVHPRTSALGDLAWRAHSSTQLRPTRVSFASIAVTAFDGERWATVAERPLRTM